MAIVQTRLRLRMLERPGLLAEPEARVLLTRRRPLALLACLIASPAQTLSLFDASRLLAPHPLASDPRTEILDLVKTLTSVDETFTEALVVEGDHLRLLESTVQTDVDALSDKIERGSVPRLLLSRPRLDAHVLEGFDRISPAFAEWLTDYRATVAERWMARLRIGFEREDHDFGVRYAMAEAAHLLDPFDEEAARASMSLAIATGNAARARRNLDRLTARLAQIGAAPGADTLAVIDEARLHEDRIATVPASATAQRRFYHQRPDTGQPVIAVLPFEVIGGTEAEIPLSSMLAEDIIQRLATQRDVAVMAANTTMGYSETTRRLYEKLHKMGADYALVGTLHRYRDALHLTVRLTDTQSSVVQKTLRRDISRKNLEAIQNEVSSDIVNAIVPGVQDVELKLSQTVSIDELTVYQIVLAARQKIFRLDRASFEEAGLLLREAIERDPLYAPAFLTRADWYSLRVNQGWSPDPAEDVQKLELDAKTAMSLGGWVARAYALLGHNKVISAQSLEAVLQAYREADELFQHALDLAPNDPETLMWTTAAAAYSGKGQIARERMERAISLTPHDPLFFRYQHFLAVAHYACEDPDEAARLARESRLRNPKYASNLRLLAAALSEIGEDAEAARIADEAMELVPGFRVAFVENSHLIRDLSMRSRYANGLRGAGFPD